jgi:hypothetical protein
MASSRVRPVASPPGQQALEGESRALAGSVLRFARTATNGDRRTWPAVLAQRPENDGIWSLWPVARSTTTPAAIKINQRTGLSANQENEDWP